MVLLLLLTWGCGGSSDKGKWQYTGKPFHQVLTGRPEDEGEVYVNKGYYIKILQATKKGNLVECFGDRVIWVETPGKRYEDGQLLGDGYYVRRGLYEYETALGAEKTVARYVQVTDKKMLLKIEKAKQEQDAKEKAEAEARIAEKQAKEKEAAEQGAYELDIPVKSLCGFTLGIPPSQVQELLQNDDGTPVKNLIGDLNQEYTSWEWYRKSYRLAKPFRLYTNAEVEFANKGFGMHLICVELRRVINLEETPRESLKAEMKATAELIENKFGITFSKDSGGQDYSWRDRGEKESINIEFDEDFHGVGVSMLVLRFEAANEVARFDKRTKEEQKTAIQLDANAGADDL